tara:strand:+ start:340 stop:540 length:201 start_codon:yes stop_codon:yes gene_type:complete
MKINIWINEELLESFYSFLNEDKIELPDNFEYFLTQPGAYQLTSEKRINILQLTISFDEYIRLRDF